MGRDLKKKTIPGGSGSTKTTLEENQQGTRKHYNVVQIWPT